MQNMRIPIFYCKITFFRGSINASEHENVIRVCFAVLRTLR